MNQSGNSLLKLTIVAAVIIAVVVAGFLLWQKFFKQTAVSSETVSTNETVAVVTISNFSFNPNNLIVSKGATVTWKHDDTATHRIVSDTGLFESVDLNRGDQFYSDFPDAGEYHYHCLIHPSMKGIITVK